MSDSDEWNGIDGRKPSSDPWDKFKRAERFAFVLYGRVKPERRVIEAGSELLPYIALLFATAASNALARWGANFVSILVSAAHANSQYGRFNPITRQDIISYVMLGPVLN